MGINFPGILAGMGAAIVLGFFWYSPAGFLNAWLDAIGKTREDMGRPVLAIVSWLIILFVLGLGVAAAFYTFQTAWPNPRAPWLDGITIGVAIWALVVIPMKLLEIVFAGQKVRALFIDGAYRLLILALMGLLVAVV